MQSRRCTAASRAGRFFSGGQKNVACSGPKSRAPKAKSSDMFGRRFAKSGNVAAAQFPGLADPTRPTQQTRPTHPTDEISGQISRRGRPCAGYLARYPARGRPRGSGLTTRAICVAWRSQVLGIAHEALRAWGGSRGRRGWVGRSMLPTMVRAESVIMSPEVNATFTTPCGRTSTMNTRLRIVRRPGSETMIVARPGARADAGMMRGMVMVSPAARRKGALAPGRDRAGAVM